MALQDRFDGLTPVAVGSPGHVWRARRRDVGDVVAVTLLDREVAEQAPRVAVRLAQVDDPHLVHVLDVVNDEGRTILIEQWVEGATLDRTIGDGGEISQQHAIATVIGVLDGLSVAHENGVAHGDLRPEVVLIESATGAPRLFGFGLGVPIPGTAARGTPETISPEAAAGRPPDPRSDVYSAGCLLFWLLTGTPPFVRSTAAAVLDAHVRNPMPWLPGAPSDVRQVVRSAMAKDPNARYASASEMADALHDAASRRFGEGWDDVSALASRAAGVAAELGPVAARSQGEDPTASPVDPATGTAPLRPAAPRASGPTPAPVPLLPELPAAPLPNPEALTWTDKPRPDPAARQRRAAEPVALEAARAERRTSLMPLILIVLLVLVALAAAGGLFYVQHHKAKPAAASVGALPTTAAPTEVPTTAFDEPTTPAPSAEPTASAAASAAPAADLGGTWTVTSTVTDVHGSIQGSDGKPLAKGDELTRTYALTQRCSAPGTCTLTALIRETGAFLSLTGDGTTYHGSVTADVPCSGAQKQPVTATLTVTVGDSADGKATRFTGTTTQTYTAAGSCPAASATTSLQGTRA